MGRLKTTTANGDTDDDGLWEEIYAYGGRSFSIWDGSGTLVFDSGDQIGHLTAAFTPDSFNANDSSATEFDNRSDDKGAEPEGLLFIPAHLSPTCNPLLLISYEESSTVTVFGMDAPGCTYLPLVTAE